MLDDLGLATTDPDGRGRQVLTLSPDPTFLADPNVTFPVTIDPAYTYTVSADTYVKSDHTAAHDSANRLYIGTPDDGATKARALLHLNAVPSAIAGKHVTEAHFALYNSYSASCGVSYAPVNLWRSNAWASDVVWSTQPNVIDRQSTQYFVHNGPNSGCGGPAYDNLDVTAVAQGWAAGTVSTRDFKINSVESSTSEATRGWKEFYSAEAGSNIPKLQITYNTVPGTPTGVSVAPCSAQCASPALTNEPLPSVYATGADADGGPLTLRYEYWTGTTGAPGTQVSSSTTTITVPAEGVSEPPEDLPDGSYVVRVRGEDGIDVSPWSPWFGFTVDTAAPPVGSLSSSWPRNAWSSTTGGTLSWTAGDASVSSYSYALDNAAPTTVPSSTNQLNLSGLSTAWHTFALTAWDAAGNPVDYPPYAFGIGEGAVTSPVSGDRTVDLVTLSAQAPSGSYTYVRFDWAKGASPSPSWQPITAGSLLTPGTSTPATATGNGTYPVGSPLSWRATDQLRVGALEVRACFATDSSSEPSTCSGPNTLQTVPAAFGATYATAPMGPGELALATGDLSVNTTDVSVASYDGTLTIGRTLTTLDPANNRGQMLTGYQHDLETDLSSFAANDTTLTSVTTPTTLGAHSLAITPNGNAAGVTDTFASLGGDIGGLRLGMQPGRTYTLSGSVYVPASTGLTPGNTARGLRLVAFTKVGTAGHVETDGTAPTTVDGWNPVSVTFRVPSGATEAFIRLYNGFASNKTNAVVYYDNLTLARDDIFGPGWTSALPGPDAGAADLSFDDESAQGYVMLTAADGAASLYLQNGAGSTFSGVGDASDGSVLTKVSSTQFTLTDPDGTATTWTSPSSGTWQVASVVEPGDAHTTSYSYDADGRPTQILGPIPPGVTCSSPLSTVGCRTLTLTYATSTTATGTDSSGWGDMTGLLKQVSFTAADPLNGNSMTTTPVASYAYDSTSLLRAAWDPRLTTPLKTTYSYTADGRLATLTPPGLNAFTFGYDSSGRLLTASRPSPSGGADTQTVVYDVPLAGTVNGATAPIPMDTGTLGGWGQISDLPAKGVAVFPASHTPAGATAATVASADWPYAGLHYLDANGREVNTASYGAGAWQLSTTTFDAVGNVIRTLSPGARDEALNPEHYPDGDAQVLGTANSADRAALLDTQSTYSTDGTMLLRTSGPLHRVILDSGVVVDGRSRTSLSYDQGAPGGGTYRLLTSSVTSVWTLDNVDHDPRTITTGYAPIEGGDTSGWTLRLPTSSTTVLGGGQDLTRITRYDPQGRVVETRMPAGTGGGDAHSTLTSYYTPGTTSGCVNTALAGLVCQSAPAAQPSSGPALPVTTMTYDRWAQPVTVTETANGATRTTTARYDAAGRICLSAISAIYTNLVPLAPTFYGYDPATGLPTQTGTLSSTPSSCPSSPSFNQLVTTGYDSNGRITSYQDASGNTSTTSYTPDSQVAQRNDGRATATYNYDSSTEHRGLLVSSSDAQAGSFTAGYDAYGELTSRTYPNGLVASTTHDEIGQDTTLRYSKGDSTWMSFTARYGSQSRIVSQASPGSNQLFGYDEAGRLVTVADTDRSTGSERCTTRNYGYDRDSNRTQQVSYPSTDTHACSTSTPGVVLTHTYDQADRITDAHYTYDAFGNTTNLVEASLDFGTGADGPLVVDGTDNPQSNPLRLSGSHQYSSISLTNGGWIAVPPGSSGILDLKSQGTVSICKSCGITATGAGGTGAPEGSASAGSGPGPAPGQPGDPDLRFGAGGGGGAGGYNGGPGQAKDSILNAGNQLPKGPSLVHGGAGGTTCCASDPWTLDPDLNTMLGGGGGAGGNQSLSDQLPTTVLAAGGAGGAGGGVLRLTAPTITNNGGFLVSSGTSGSPGNALLEGNSGGGGGGGGGAGTVWLRADTLNLGPTPPVSDGGPGGDWPSNNGGGSGAYGRVRLDALDTTGSAPSYSVWQYSSSPQLGTLTYYVNNMVASNAAGGITHSWTLDPAGRLLVQTQGSTSTTNHYSDGGDSASWTATGSGAWTRNVQGLAGELAVQVSSTGAQTLQLANLHGDIVATLPNSASATGIASFAEQTEFGQPRTASTATYGWLGAHRRATDSVGNLVLMGVRLYNPSSGRFLQTDPVPGGSSNAYDYAGQDPINRFDLDGKCWRHCPWGRWAKKAGKHTYNSASFALNPAGELLMRHGSIGSVSLR